MTVVDGITIQDEKMDPERLRREREELEMHKKRGIVCVIA